MKIEFDTDNLSSRDISILSALIAETMGTAPEIYAVNGQEGIPTPEATPVAAPKKTAPPARTATVDEIVAAATVPTEVSGTTAGEVAPSKDEAIARATQMVSTGEASKVKAALATVGVKKVSELTADQVVEFLNAL